MTPELRLKLNGVNQRVWLEAVGTVQDKVMSAVEKDQTQPGWMWPWGHQERRDRWMEADHTGPCMSC